MNSIHLIKGYVQYVFKGIKMRAEAGTGLVQGNAMTVSFENLTDVKSSFVKIEDQWLLQSHTKANSLLYGTTFVPIKEYE